MTDRRWCANPNAVLEVDPCTRAVGLSRSDVVPGALEGVHIDWRDPRAVTVALKSRKSDVGKLWDDILTWPPAVKLGGSPLLDGVRLPPPRVEAVEPGLSSPRQVETALGPAASGRDLADILPPPGSQSGEEVLTQRAAVNLRVLVGGLARRARPTGQILNPIRELFSVMKEIQLWSVDRAEGKLSATAVEHRGPTEGRAHGC